MGTDNFDNTLRNVAEGLVKEKVREMMPKYDVCQCEKCFLDVCAIVLNTLDPQYATTEEGYMFSLENPDYEYLSILILEAFEKVKESPQH
jgi:competence protein ComFB